VVLTKCAPNIMRVARAGLILPPMEARQDDAKDALLARGDQGRGPPWPGRADYENPPLARSVTVRGGGPAIPVDLYAAVAAILAYLSASAWRPEMRERRATRGGGQERSPGPAGQQAGASPVLIGE